MKKKLTKKDKEYQYSKKYSFKELELAFGHSIKMIQAKDQEIAELKEELINKQTAEVE